MKKSFLTFCALQILFQFNVFGQSSSPSYFLKHLTKQEYLAQYEACINSSFKEIETEKNDSLYNDNTYNWLIATINKIVDKKFSDEISKEEKKGLTLITYKISYSINMNNLFVFVNFYKKTKKMGKVLFLSTKMDSTAPIFIKSLHKKRVKEIFEEIIKPPNKLRNDVKLHIINGIGTEILITKIEQSKVSNYTIKHPPHHLEVHMHYITMYPKVNEDKVLTFIGVKANDVNDTIYHKTFNTDSLDERNWKVVIGKQDYLNKIYVFDDCIDTLNTCNTTIEDHSYGCKTLYYPTNFVDNNDITYSKNYDKNNKIVAEGLLVPDYLIYDYKKKKNWTLIPVGVWKFYNGNQNIQHVHMHTSFEEYELVLK